VLDIRFPVGGVSRRQGFNLQAKKESYTTPWAVNCRPEDPLAKRLRGGSRPGVTAYTDGDAPTWPTSELLDESGTTIITEAGAEILLPVWGSEALQSDLAEALAAYGVAYFPETLTATSGTAPTSPSVGCVYRARLVLSCTDHIIYMSRQGDFCDWDYGQHADDSGRAVLFQLSEAEEQGDTVTALVPHRDRYLLAATTNSLWVLEGDPAATGTLANVSRHVGILSSTAWCKAQDTVFFLSEDGLYGVGSNGSGLKNLSGDHLPEELLDIDLTSVSVLLGYNHGESGIYIFLVGGDYHYYYDLEAGGFWPFTLPAALDPVRVLQVGGRMIAWDGSSTYYEMDGDDDAGTDIESHVVIGPFRPGSPNEYGMLAAIHGAIDTDTGGAVTWRIVTGDSAEEACDRAKTAVDAYLAGNTTTAETYVSFSGTWNTGRSYIAHPRVRAMWFVIWLQSDDQWSFEAIAAEIQKFGNWR
jgi:hypothetical protein